MRAMKLDEALEIIKNSNLKAMKPDGHPMDFAFAKFEIQYANDLSTPEKQSEFFDGFYGSSNKDDPNYCSGINSESVWKDRTFEYNGRSFIADPKTNLIKFRYTKGVMLFEVAIKSSRKYDSDEWAEIIKAFYNSEAYDDILNSLEEETPLKIVKSTLRRSNFWR